MSFTSHLIKPVLNGLSDLLRLPQYPVLGVRAAALTGVRREGELYTRLQGGGKGGREDAQDGHKLGKNSRLSPSLHRGRAPRRQPRPNGQVPPRMPRPARPMSPTSPDSPITVQGRRAFSCIGTLAAHPHPRAHASLPSLLAHIRSSDVADGLATQEAARVRCQTRGAQHFGPPRPRLRRGRYDGPACLQLFARAASPSPAQKSPRPEATSGCGLKEQMQVLICLASRRPGGGRRWP